ANNTARGFRETGQMAVSSTGTVEAFWTENADSKKLPSLQVAAVSTDGGQTFSAPITIAPVTDYPLTGTPFDVVDLFNRVPGVSARVDCYPPARRRPLIRPGVRGVVRLQQRARHGPGRRVRRWRPLDLAGHRGVAGRPQRVLPPGGRVPGGHGQRDL